MQRQWLKASALLYNVKASLPDKDEDGYLKMEGNRVNNYLNFIYTKIRELAEEAVYNQHVRWYLHNVALDDWNPLPDKVDCCHIDAFHKLLAQIIYIYINDFS